MLQRKLLYGLAVLAMVCVCGVYPAMAQEGKKLKVLVVMSYEENNPWCMEIKEGIDSVLGKTCEIKYFYMDTKINPKDGTKKAEEAFSLYKSYQPDGVITADDNAQSMFVVPYLKDKVKTPVMFNGVNADAEQYGYPASNVSGMLERYHIAESIALAKQLMPSIKTVGFIMKDDSTGNAVIKQIKGESDSYSAKAAEFKMPKTLKEVISATEELKSKCDALFTFTLTGTTDDSGKALTDKEIIPIVVKTFGKTVIGANRYHLQGGALCTVINSGQEQGETSAKMLLKAMQGTPTAQIPITRNHQGKRVVNPSAMSELKIKAQPEIIGGAESVKTEN